MILNHSSTNGQTLSLLAYTQQGDTTSQTQQDSATLSRGKAEQYPTQRTNTNLGVTENQEEGGTFTHVAAILAVVVFLVVAGVVLVRVFKGLGGDGH